MNQTGMAYGRRGCARAEGRRLPARQDERVRGRGSQMDDLVDGPGAPHPEGDAAVRHVECQRDRRQQQRTNPPTGPALRQLISSRLRLAHACQACADPGGHFLVDSLQERCHHRVAADSVAPMTAPRFARRPACATVTRVTEPASASLRYMTTERTPLRKSRPVMPRSQGSYGQELIHCTQFCNGQSRTLPTCSSMVACYVPVYDGTSGR